MIAIRGNFFYTRTVPCELWFLNKAKPKAFQDKVLMLDARGVYRKATRKIFDFSPRTVRSWSRFTLRFSTNSRAQEPFTGFLIRSSRSRVEGRIGCKRFL